MKPVRLVVAAIAAVTVSAAFASPSSPVFDREMAPVLTAYLQIGHALAQDRLDGVPAAARRIAVAARHLQPNLTRGHYGSLPVNLVRTARALAGARDLKTARHAFEALGRHLVIWVVSAKPAGTRILYCPMVKATWVETGTGIHNPYLGRAHETCGRVMIADPSR